MYLKLDSHFTRVQYSTWYWYQQQIYRALNLGPRPYQSCDWPGNLTPSRLWCRSYVPGYQYRYWYMVLAGPTSCTNVSPTQLPFYRQYSVLISTRYSRMYLVDPTAIGSIVRIMYSTVWVTVDLTTMIDCIMPTWYSYWLAGRSYRYYYLILLLC